LAGQCLRMNASTFELSFIDEPEAFATRFVDFAVEEDKRFARAPRMLSVYINDGESDSRERIAAPLSDLLEERMASFQRLALHRSCRSPAARADLSSDKRPLRNLCALSEQKQNL
jgi:hypothetical protein